MNPPGRFMGEIQPSRTAQTATKEPGGLWRGKLHSGTRLCEVYRRAPPNERSPTQAGQSQNSRDGAPYRAPRSGYIGSGRIHTVNPRAPSSVAPAFRRDCSTGLASTTVCPCAVGIRVAFSVPISEDWTPIKGFSRLSAPPTTSFENFLLSACTTNDLPAKQRNRSPRILDFARMGKQQENRNRLSMQLFTSTERF